MHLFCIMYKHNCNDDVNLIRVSILFCHWNTNKSNEEQILKTKTRFKKKTRQYYFLNHYIWRSKYKSFIAHLLCFDIGKWLKSWWPYIYTIWVVSKARPLTSTLSFFCFFPIKIVEVNVCRYARAKPRIDKRIEGGIRINTYISNPFPSPVYKTNAGMNPLWSNDTYYSYMRWTLTTSSSLSYIKHCFVPYKANRYLHSGQKSLFIHPRTFTSLGHRAFAIAAPCLLNKLPDFVKSASSLRSFKSQLKIFIMNSESSYFTCCV